MGAKSLLNSLYFVLVLVRCCCCVGIDRNLAIGVWMTVYDTWPQDLESSYNPIGDIQFFFVVLYDVSIRFRFNLKRVWRCKKCQQKL